MEFIVENFTVYIDHFLFEMRLCHWLIRLALSLANEKRVSYIKDIDRLNDNR